MPSPFDEVLARRGLGPLRRDRLRTLQVNLGKRCNQACLHCHVEAGPLRTEAMTAETVDRVIALVAASRDVEVVDLTGGAPELNPEFRRLVTAVRALGRRVIDRCNLTILLEPGHEDLAAFLAGSGVEVVASLPCYGPDNVEAQRGRGVFAGSIEALRRLNALGYGVAGSPLSLSLVYNPIGPSLPPDQASLEARYRLELRAGFAIEFNRLLTITNMPISRFADALRRTGQEGRYLRLLEDGFNPATVDGLMCRTLLSVGWDGRLYDCDFNQMLELPCGAAPPGAGPTVWDLASLDELGGRAIVTDRHCFACTAGAGSGCSGAVQPGPPTGSS